MQFPFDIFLQAVLAFGYFVTAVFYIALLFLVIRREVQPGVKWSFVAFLIGLLLWHITLYLYLFVYLGDAYLLFIGRLNYATGPFFTFGLLSFFYYFPTENFTVPKYVKFGFLISTFLIFLITLFTPLIDANEMMTAEGPIVTLGSWYSLYLLQVCGFPLLSILLGIKKSLALQGLEQVRFRYVFWVFVPTILIFFISNLILPIFGYIEQFQYSFLFIAPIAIASFYAMHRYRFFNLSNATLNILRKLLVGAFTVLAIAFLYGGLQYTNYSSDNLFVEIIIFSVGVFTFLTLNKVFPEFVTAGFREFRSALLELKTQIYTSATFEKLQFLLDQTFSLRLNIPNAKIFVVRKNPENIKLAVYLQDSFTAELEKRKDLLVTEELKINTRIAAAKKKILLPTLQKLGAAICLPLILENRLIGFFVLGKKEHDESYPAEELQEILDLRRPLQITLMNFLLQNNLQEERDLLKAVVEEKTKSLQVLVKQQSDFMAVAAHEIRTPLSIAIFKVQEILEEAKKYDIPTELFAGVQDINTALAHMKGLTQQLFEVQQYELGKMELHKKPLSIQAFLEKIAEEFEPLMESKSIRLSFKKKMKGKGEIEIVCDEEKLRQVLHNLLTNALKFTPKGGRVELGLEMSSTRVQIFVRDNGKGIGDPEKKKIFEKFQTAKPTMGMGIGLGLYLCEQIIALHRGKIWVEDSPGGGATFMVELPRK